MTLVLLLLLLVSGVPAPPGRAVGREGGRGGRDITAFLQAIDLECYVELFRSEEITLELLPYVTEAQLQRIGVRTLVQRMRIVRSAQDQLDNRGENAVIEMPVNEDSEFVTERPNANEPDNEIDVAVPENQVDGACTLHTAHCSLHTVSRLDKGMENIRNYIPNIGDAQIEAWCHDFLAYVQQYWMDGQFPRYPHEFLYYKSL